MSLPDRPSAFRTLRMVAAVSLIALATAGCLKKDGDVTGSLATPASGTPEAWRAYADEWGKRYDAKPGDKTASLNYARALRALDQRQQAVAVLQSAALKSPKDTDILAAYGKTLAENGDLKQAQEVLSRSHTPERPDWRILSAQGAVADQMGDHMQAQSLYAAALKIQPNDPGVLSNLGLSYALSKQLPQAEQTLRLAAEQPSADARVRQNLALVLGLQGKFGEAETVARRDMNAVEAAQSVASMRQMVSQPNNWAKIKAADGGNRSTTVAKSPATGASGSANASKGRPLALAPSASGEDE